MRRWFLWSVVSWVLPTAAALGQTIESLPPVITPLTGNEIFIVSQPNAAAPSGFTSRQMTLNLLESQFAVPGGLSATGIITPGQCAAWASSSTLRASGTPCPAPVGAPGQVQANGGGGAFSALSNAQLTADINAFSSTLSGAVPASGGGTVNFLRADGTWTAPPGGGGSGSGTVTSVGLSLPTGLSVIGSPITTNGTFAVSWSGTIPAAQLPNPTSGSLGGVASAGPLTNQWINAINTSGVPQLSQPAFSNLSGNIATSQMNSGTGASATTFWRGDGTWQTPSGAGNVSTSGTITTGRCAQWASATTLLATATACGSGGGAPSQRLVTTSPITLTGTDQIINVNIASGTPSATLPGYASRSGGLVYFKDVGGHFAAANLTINAAMGETIDGQSSITLTADYSSVTLVPANDGTSTGWYIQ